MVTKIAIGQQTFKKTASIISTSKIAHGLNIRGFGMSEPLIAKLEEEEEEKNEDDESDDDDEWDDEEDEE